MKLILALILSFVFAVPTFAQGINKMAHIQALVSSERDKRSWKSLWLMPGRYKFHYYQWVLEDGTVVTKVETTLIKGIPDQRPLKQSHPNLAIAIPATQTAASVATSLLVGK